MHVEIKTAEDREGNHHQCLLIDGEEVVSVHPLYECPEDAIIGRDLIDCNQISNFMAQAFNAAVDGETLEIKSTECDIEDLW